MPRANPKPPPPAPVAPEDLTTRIILLLQEDGRMAFSTIATQLGVSEGTVRNRVRQLLDDNVISIQAEAMPGAFGYTVNTVTFLKVRPSANIDEVAALFSDIAEVFYVVQMIGRFDLGIAAYHKTIEDYRAFLNRHCYGNDALSDVETTLNVKIHKLNTRWQVQV